MTPVATRVGDSPAGGPQNGEAPETPAPAGVVAVNRGAVPPGASGDGALARGQGTRSTPVSPLNMRRATVPCGCADAHLIRRKVTAMSLGRGNRSAITMTRAPQSRSRSPTSSTAVGPPRRVRRAGASSSGGGEQHRKRRMQRPGARTLRRERRASPRRSPGAAARRAPVEAPSRSRSPENRRAIDESPPRDRREAREKRPQDPAPACDANPAEVARRPQREGSPRISLRLQPRGVEPHGRDRARPPAAPRARREPAVAAHGKRHTAASPHAAASTIAARAADRGVPRIERDGDARGMGFFGSGGGAIRSHA